MNFAPLLAAGMLATASVQHTEVDRTARFVAQNNAVVVPAPEGSQHGVPAPPAIGSNAPDFTYQSFDYQWRNLHHMLAQGSVLLVFGASDEQLQSLERDRESLLRRGVVPVAVVNHRESDVWRTVSRFGLSYSLLADPHTAIAEQFGAVDSARHATPAWFVIDPSGKVRGSGAGTPPGTDWVALSGTALGHLDISTAGAR